MKKLMIAACAVGFAAAAQAASVTWSSGDILPLGSCSGEGDYSVNECVQMLVWEFSEANWKTDYQDGAKLFAAYKAGDLGDASATATADWLFGTTEATGLSTWADGQAVKAAVLFLHNDDGKFDEADYYMANYATAEASDLGGSFSNLGNSINGGDTATTWQSVPEPTSGLLLLLGVAGLALRRRRA